MWKDMSKIGMITVNIIFSKIIENYERSNLVLCLKSKFCVTESKSYKFLTL